MCIYAIYNLLNYTYLKWIIHSTFYIEINLVQNLCFSWLRYLLLQHEFHLVPWFSTLLLSPISSKKKKHTHTHAKLLICSFSEWLLCFRQTANQFLFYWMRNKKDAKMFGSDALVICSRLKKKLKLKTGSWLTDWSWAI